MVGQYRKASPREPHPTFINKGQAVRVLLTLIKSQLIDNAIYFVVAAVIAAVLVVAVIAVTLSEELTYLSSYALALILTTPIFFCIGSYAVGLTQTYIDRTIGISALLPTQPVRDWQIFLARFVIGTLVILTVLGPLAITGAILWRLLGPPQWLFHGWVADVFIGFSLTCMTCYCLGFYAGRRAEKLASALRPLPLTVIILLLVIIKGFGRPLLIVLVPLLVLLLFLCCKRSIGQSMKTVATGFMVIFFLIIPLSLGRYVYDGILVAKIDATAKISPSGVLRPEIENDPNITEHSEASGSVNPWPWHRCIVHALLGSHSWEFTKRFYAGHYLLEDSGIIQYFESLEKGVRHSYYPLGTWGPFIELIHFDEVGGQLVCHHKELESYLEKDTWEWDGAVVLYVGPEGMSTNRHEAIGQFESPVIYLRLASEWLKRPPVSFVYDKKTHRFFAFDFEAQTMRIGPKLPHGPICPVDIGYSEEADLFAVSFSHPHHTYSRYQVPPENLTTKGYLPVFNESGRIDLLDPNTLELRGPAGYLPRPRTPAGWAAAKLRDLLGYDVDIISLRPRIGPPLKGDMEGEYLGLVTGSLSRQGMWASVAIFDKDGRLVKTAHSEANFFKQPWGPALSVAKYFFESLHPPVSTLASFFTAYSFDARSTHRALFLMPNSFVAMTRDYQGNIFYMFVIVLLLMLPGLLLAGVLAWRVDRDAVEIGLSLNARRLWLAGTLCFGLVGYTTYRLTRPVIALVTCANCGNPRRPDMEKCHRCGSPWHVPELTPPPWRVLDGARVHDCSTARTEETTAQ